MPIHVLGITFGPILDLSNDEEFSIDHQMAVDGENVFVVWDDDGSIPSSIMIKVSNNAGISFLAPEIISNGDDSSASAGITAIGNTVYVVWVNEAVGSGDIYFRKGIVSGGTLAFDDEQNISDTPETSLNPRIAVSDDNVFILWEEDVGGYNDIFYAASSDDGNDFIQNNLSNTTGIISENAQVVASGDEAYITWNDVDNDVTGISDAYFIKGTVSGSSISFSDITNLSANLGNFAFAPKIAVSGSNVHIVWEDLNLADIFYATSIDTGSSFDIPADATDNNVSNNNNSASPSVFAFDESVHIVWVNNNEGNGDVFYNQGTISGSTLTFAGENDIDGDPLTASLPSISVSGTNVYVTWESLENPSEIFLSASTDGGSSFDVVNLSNNIGVSMSPRIASSIDRGYVAWLDDASGDFDILFRTIAESGPPSISIESISDTSPRWGLDAVVVSGLVNGNGTDTISIDWDDGNVTSGIAFNNTTWAPVSHFYNSTNTGSKQILVTLLNETGSETASDTDGITVQKHTTHLTIDPIFSVVEGIHINVTGALTDIDESAPINGMNITFVGSGAAGLPTAITLADGSFSQTGASPSLVDELLTVQAQFSGTTAYSPSNSEIERYDTVAMGSAEFAVLKGTPAGPIDLTGFNASIIFNSVLSDGSIFVSTCDSPASTRYEPLTTDLCIKLSPALELELDFVANLTISFDENSIPEGFTIEDVSMFHEGSDGITDITAARDEDTGTVTGSIADFSKFIVGAALHDDAPAGAARQQIFVGNNDILFDFTATKEIALDAAQYIRGETVTLNVTDPSQNLDDSLQETIEATVNSTSEQGGIIVELLETGNNTNIFAGTFALAVGSSSNTNARLHVEEGDNIQASYEDRAPFRVIINNVTEAGIVELVDFHTNGAGGIIDPVGDGYTLALIDARIAVDTIITITMSYANVDFFLGDDPSLLKMYRMDGNACVESMNHSVDPDEKTVTGNTTEFGHYSMVISGENPPGQCPVPGGGGGGGLPRPGNGGLLLDFATILGTIEESDEPKNNNGESGGRRVVLVTNQPSQLLPTISVLPNSHFDDHPLDRIEVNDADFFDADGNDISQADAGQQISITSKFTNHQQQPQDYSFIVMVVDEEGFATDITWQEGTIEGGQSADLSTTWTPQQTGKYMIKMFVWDGFNNPSPLSQALVTNIAAD